MGLKVLIKKIICIECFITILQENGFSTIPSSRHLFLLKIVLSANVLHLATRESSQGYSEFIPWDWSATSLRPNQLLENKKMLTNLERKQGMILATLFVIIIGPWSNHIGSWENINKMKKKVTQPRKICPSLPELNSWKVPFFAETDLRLVPVY